MKKFVKVMLIIAAVFASLGIGLAAGGAVMGASSENADIISEVGKRFKDTFDMAYDIDIAELVRDDGEVKKGNAEGDSRIYNLGAAEKLEIELKSDELIFEEHTGTGIIVEVKNDSIELVKVSESGNTIKITSHGKRITNRIVKVSFPKDMKFHEAEISVSAGSVNVRGNISADKLKVHMGAGEFLNSGFITAKEADLEVGAGSMVMKGLNAQEIDGECGVGEMSLEINGKEQDYSYSLECGIGEINLGADSYSGLGKEKSINNPGAKGAIDLECGIGEIAVSFTE